MKKLVLYFKDVYNELINKVSWPSWTELQSSGIVVLIASFIIGIIVFIIDYLLGVNSSQNIWRGMLGFIYDLIA